MIALHLKVKIDWEEDTGMITNVILSLLQSHIMWGSVVKDAVARFSSLCWGMNCWTRQKRQHAVPYMWWISCTRYLPQITARPPLRLALVYALSAISLSSWMSSIALVICRKRLQVRIGARPACRLGDSTESGVNTDGPFFITAIPFHDHFMEWQWERIMIEGQQSMMYL